MRRPPERRRRYARPSPFAPRAGLTAIALAALLLAPPARAAEIVLETSGVLKLVVQSLYRDQGRYLLSRAPCLAYLDNPSVTLRDGRIFLRSNLGGRIGADVNGSCVGLALSSWAVVSGVPRAQGSTVRLTDVRIEDVQDPNLRLLLDSGLVPSLPQALELDVQRAVKAMLQGGGAPLDVDVQQLDIESVAVTDRTLVVRFDFRLRGR